MGEDAFPGNFRNAGELSPIGGATDPEVVGDAMIREPPSGLLTVKI
jgi:hypothetical protein